MTSSMENYAEITARFAAEVAADNDDTTTTTTTADGGLHLSRVQVCTELHMQFLSQLAEDNTRVTKSLASLISRSRDELYQPVMKWRDHLSLASSRLQRVSKCGHVVNELKSLLLSFRRVNSSNIDGVKHLMSIQERVRTMITQYPSLANVSIIEWLTTQCSRRVQRLTTSLRAWAKQCIRITTTPHDDDDGGGDGGGKRRMVAIEQLHPLSLYDALCRVQIHGEVVEMWCDQLLSITRMAVSAHQHEWARKTTTTTTTTTTGNDDDDKQPTVVYTLTTSTTIKTDTTTTAPLRSSAACNKYADEVDMCLDRVVDIFRTVVIGGMFSPPPPPPPPPSPSSNNDGNTNNDSAYKHRVRDSFVDAMRVQLWSSLVEVIITNVLEKHVPRNLASLRFYDRVRDRVCRFEDECTTIGLCDTRALSEWTQHFIQHYCEAQCRHAREDVRSLLLTNSYDVWNKRQQRYTSNDADADEDHSEQPPQEEEEEEEKQSSITLKHALSRMSPERLHWSLCEQYTRTHACDITQRSADFMRVLCHLTHEAVNGHSSSGVLTHAQAMALVQTCRDLVYMFLVSTPNLAGDQLSQVPHMSVLMFNDCNFISSCLVSLQTLLLYPQSPSSLSSSSSSSTAVVVMFVDLVAPLRKLGQHYFVAQIEQQRVVLNEILTELEQVFWSESGDRGARVLQQLLHTLDRLCKVWTGVLPAQALYTLVSGLVETTITTLMTWIVNKSDISVKAGVRVHEYLITIATHEPLHTFYHTTDDDDDDNNNNNKMTIDEWIPSWHRFGAFICFLAPDQSLRGLEDDFRAGKFHDYFTFAEVTHLVHAIYEESEKRTKCLRNIETAMNAQAKLPDFVS